MTENLVHWSDEAQLLGFGESDSAGAWIKFRITPADLDMFRGHKGTVFYLTTVEIAADGQPVVNSKVIDDPFVKYVETGEATQDFRNNMARGAMDKVATAEARPFGKQASELYRSGFFYVPAVLEAIGGDAEFLDWVRAQPCAVTELRDYHKDEATGVVTERCDAAHVRTVANGAGTAIKPPYCAIPLVHHLHDVETRHGKAALYLAANVGYEAMPQNVLETAASEWMDKLRNKYVVVWASHRLANLFAEASMGHVNPKYVRKWAADNGTEHYLPAAYK